MSLTPGWKGREMYATWRAAAPLGVTPPLEGSAPGSGPCVGTRSTPANLEHRATLETLHTASIAYFRAGRQNWFRVESFGFRF
jgi:hypothetical protein